MEKQKIFNSLTVIACLIIAIGLIAKIFPSDLVTNQQEKQWVWIELETELIRDTTDYFYYGQINKSLIDKIDSNESLEGLFILSNIRYWNDDDLLQVYEDDNHSDSKVFKIQAIHEFVLYKDDPINLFEIDELHESAKELKDATTLLTITKKPK